MRKFRLVAVALITISCVMSPLVITKQQEKEVVAKAYGVNNINIKSDLSAVTCIDTIIQSHSIVSLKKQLVEYNADYGCVLLMETNTGKIRAMVNLESINGKVKESKTNYTIHNYMEPGSFIKTMDLMALLEDKKADTSTVYSTHNGEVSFYGKTVNDGHKGGFGDISLAKALLYSSNTVFAQAITQAYAKNPDQFFAKFKQFQLGTNLDLPFANSNNHIIPNPKSNNWSNISLPWMSFGYGLTLSPIQILTYYNGIANGGELVKPLFLSEIKNTKGQIKSYDKTVLASKMCSEQTLLQIQDLLKKVVTEGTGLSCKSTKVAIAGKTASVQINYASGTDKQYLTGFVGYFPSSKPKYSIITIISNPKSTNSYYGADIAGIVVRDIAEKIK
jgi:cell division protein FtsI (penicillin-binding protein 3)